jgi:hypothetical protein
MTPTTLRAVSSLLGPRRAISVALLLVASVAVACGGKVHATGGAPVSTGGSAPTAALSEAQLTRLVAKAATIKKLPADVTPSLADAPTDFEDIKAGGRCAAISAPESGKCVYGDTKGAKLAVLYGDSHAGMWLTALDAAAKRAHWRVILLSHAACPAPEFTYVDERGKSKGCRAFRKVAIAHIRRLKPDLLVATGASPGERIQGDRVATDAEWENGWIKALQHLRTPGQKQVLLGDIPVLPKVNPDCLAAHLSNVQACGAPRSAALDGVQIEAEKKAARATGARYVYVVPWICSSICSPVIGNTIVFRNQFHITAAFARLVSGPLGRALGWRASRP